MICVNSLGIYFTPTLRCVISYKITYLWSTFTISMFLCFPPTFQDANSPRYFLGGVTEDITHQDLKEYFKQFGPLIDVTIIPNKSIGYIQYRKSSEGVEADREEKLFHQKHQIKNKLINCSRANPKQVWTVS